MPQTREELERREREVLAPYAQWSVLSRGRVHQEPPADWRTHYQRDRDRVIHSKAFRRLEYKTQVFLNGTGDHYRTRLTHTMEVAAIARNIARGLGLNEDLAETIALAHDLGHAPFGHKGEEVLNELMEEQGGFEHNRQSLRIVEQLEQKYPDFSGLNLTWEVREGLMKHCTTYDRPAARSDFVASSASLEAQVANIADEIAYYSHDLDDGLESGLLSEKALNRSVKLWRDASRRVVEEHGRLSDECRRYFIIRCLIDSQVRDVVLTAERRIRKSGVQSVDEVRAQPASLVSYSRERRLLNEQLREYLHQNLYYNPVVHLPNLRAAKCLVRLFHFFLKSPAEIGSVSRRRIRRIGLHRAICDYISGMTDRYAMQEYRRLIRSS